MYPYRSRIIVQEQGNQYVKFILAGAALIGGATLLSPVALIEQNILYFAAQIISFVAGIVQLNRGARLIFKRLMRRTAVRVRWLLAGIGVMSAVVATGLWFLTREPAIVVIYLIGLTSLILWISAMSERPQIIAGAVFAVGLVAVITIGQYNMSTLAALIHRYPLSTYDPRYLHNWNTFVLSPYLLLIAQTFGVLAAASWISPVINARRKKGNHPA